MILASFLTGATPVSFSPGDQQPQTQGQDSKEETFEKVDPYTHGDPKAMERSGYVVSYGPFAWAEGVRTTDVAETMGGADVLWLETPHFKIGSTLQSYHLHNDVREEKALEAELARAKSKLAGFVQIHNRLDPWLRLHLFAMRLEDVYEDFSTWFGTDAADDPKKSGDAARKAALAKKSMTPGDPEGRPKIRVLLVARTSGLARYTKHFSERELQVSDRFPLPGGLQFFGVSEEGARAHGYDLEIAFRCVVSGGVVPSLIEASTGSHATCPLWLVYGLDHVVTRGVDERFPNAAINTVRIEDESSFRWDARVKGLVTNGLAPSWPEIAAWKSWDEIKVPGHLVAWSRVSWLLKRKPAELRAFLTQIAGGPVEMGVTGGGRTPFAKQSAAAKAAFGKSLEDLDALWKKQASR